jgi:hypothetical protein
MNSIGEGIAKAKAEVEAMLKPGEEVRDWELHISCGGDEVKGEIPLWIGRITFNFKLSKDMSSNIGMLEAWLKPENQTEERGGIYAIFNFEIGV